MTLRFKPRSLKRQLLIFLLTALMLIWSLSVYISYQRSREEIAELFNAELAQSARVVHAFVENLLRQKRLSRLWDQDKSPELFSIPLLGHKYERKIAFQLRSTKDGVVLRSESAPEYPLSETRNGYSETTIGDQLWHVFSITSENGDYVIQIGQRDDIRQQLANIIAGQQALELLFSLPAFGLVIWVIVSRTLRPLNRLRKQLAARQAGNLKPLSLVGHPDEVVPMVKQINELFVMLEQAFTNERHFTSDASHELRTPLAGMQTWLQVAEKTSDQNLREQALHKALLGVGRMNHLVQQLLILSRVQHDVQVDKTATDLQHALTAVIGDLEHLARDKAIVIALESPPDMIIHANQQLLNILLRNLLDNAIKYTPQGGNVLVSLSRPSPQDLALSVEDSGPGVAHDEYARLTQRFYRCVETAQLAEGSGLGLSIVQRILKLHAADIEFGKSQLGGLRVTVKFQALTTPN